MLKSFSMYQAKPFSQDHPMAAPIPTPASLDTREEPHFITDVARVCGIEVANKIQARFGGTRVYVPMRPEAHHELSKLIGLENAQLVATEVGGGQVNVPLGESGLLANRQSPDRAPSHRRRA